MNSVTLLSVFTPSPLLFTKDIFLSIWLKRKACYLHSSDFMHIRLVAQLSHEGRWEEWGEIWVTWWVNTWWRRCPWPRARSSFPEFSERLYQGDSYFSPRSLGSQPPFPSSQSSNKKVILFSYFWLKVKKSPQMTLPINSLFPISLVSFFHVNVRGGRCYRCVCAWVHEEKRKKKRSTYLTLLNTVTRITEMKKKRRK